MSDLTMAERRLRTYAERSRSGEIGLDVREVLSTIDALRASYEERGRVIDALVRGERPTCETCQHRYVSPQGSAPACGLTRMTDGIHPTVTIVPCRFLGNGCYAHTPKGGAK